MAKNIPILFVPVEASPAEIAAYRGLEVRQVRKNLAKTRGVCRTSQKAVGIHLGTYLAENFLAQDAGKRI